MYFSSKNKNYMFQIIRDIIIKETNEDINNITEYIDLYRFKYPLIFDRSNSDTIVNLNKELIDVIAPIIINDIKSKYISKNIEIIPKEEIKETVANNNIKQQYIINSSQRDGLSLNRYSYNINVDSNIISLIIKQINIPKENNILFLNPIICIQIKNDENSFNIYCQYIEELIIQNKTYYIFKPYQDLKIKSSSKIKINLLTNLLSEILVNNDIFNVDKIKTIEFKKNNYLCLKITDKHELKENDTIGILENDKLIKTIIINKNINNNLLFLNETIKYDNNNKYKIINMDLQNTIIFQVN